MHLPFVGCGDAFGSGGRLDTGFHVAGAGASALIDCGATALVGRKRLGIDRNAIAMILVMHVHADPFGGVPVFSLDAPFFARRTRPLVIAGPVGLRDSFPGATGVRQTVEIALADLRPADAWKNGGVSVPPTPARHDPPGGPFHADRPTASRSAAGPSPARATARGPTT